MRRRATFHVANGVHVSVPDCASISDMTQCELTWSCVWFTDVTRGAYTSDHEYTPYLSDIEVSRSLSSLRSVGGSVDVEIRAKVYADSISSVDLVTDRVFSIQTTLEEQVSTRATRYTCGQKSVLHV